MPTPSLTNHESPQQFDFRPMIAAKIAEVQYLLGGLCRSPYYNYAGKRKMQLLEN